MLPTCSCKLGLWVEVSGLSGHGCQKMGSIQAASLLYAPLHGEAEPGGAAVVHVGRSRLCFVLLDGLALQSW